MAKDYDIAKKTVQDEILDAVTNLETSLTGELTASVVKSIQRGVITIDTKATEGTATINAVNMSKAVVLFSGYSGGDSSGSSDSMSYHKVRMELTDATTVTATRDDTNTSYGGGAQTVPYQVLEFY